MLIVVSQMDCWDTLSKGVVAIVVAIKFSVSKQIYQENKP